MREQSTRLVAMISGRLLAATIVTFVVILGLIYLADSVAEALRMVIFDPFFGG